METHEQPDVGERPVTVLLAEDEFLVRLTLAEELRHAGWQVIEVGSADEGIEVVRSAVPLDLVVTDVHMPGSNDGLDLAREVRRERPGAKVVVMSGLLKPLRAQEDLFDIFISKPATELRLLLDDVIGKSSALSAR